MISIWDHLVVASFAVALPIYARYNYPRFKRRVESGASEARSEQYRMTTSRQWALAIFALVVWFAAGRSPDALGLGAPSGRRFWLGLAIAVALAMAWRRLVLATLGDPEGRERLISQLRPVQPLLPITSGELRLFTLLSVTAGICEELLFRGYLIWYLDHYVGFTLACVVSGVAFGLGHFYQGLRQAAKIIVLGLVFVAFYVGTGTLWVPMALHALLDAAQGKLAHRLLSGSAA